MFQILNNLLIMSRKRQTRDEDEEIDGTSILQNEEFFTTLAQHMTKFQERSRKKEEEREIELRKSNGGDSWVHSILSYLPFGWGKLEPSEQLFKIIGSIVLPDYTEVMKSALGSLDGPKSVTVFEFFVPYNMCVKLKILQLVSKIAVYFKLKKGRTPGELGFEIHLTEDKLSLHQYYQYQLKYANKEPVTVSQDIPGSDFLRRFLKAVTTHLDIETNPRFQLIPSFTENSDESCIQTVYVQPDIEKYDIIGGLDRYAMFYDFWFQAEEETDKIMLHLEILTEQRPDAKKKKTVC